MTLLIFYLLPLFLCHWKESCSLVMSEIQDWSTSPIPVWNFKSLSLLLLCLYLLLEFLLHSLKHKFASLFWPIPSHPFSHPSSPNYYFFVCAFFSKSVVKNIKLRAHPEPCTCKPSLFISFTETHFSYSAGKPSSHAAPSVEWDTARLFATGKQRSKGL